MRLLANAVAVAALLAAPLAVADPAPRDPAAAVAPLLGTTPPEWEVTRWLNSSPLKLADLRGKVVLVRWWTAGCPFCSASAPLLRALDREYRSRGLAVVGVYHHKEDAPFDPRVYDATATKYGFGFPLAFDPEWRTFRQWMRGVDTGFTSVTFVLDRRGVVRYVHPGGQYVEGDGAAAELRTVVERLLADR